ncbi:MAG: hypothetical protein V2A54_03865 [Bacteroidota bacterium]
MVTLVRYYLKQLLNQNSWLPLLLFTDLLLPPVAWTQTNTAISRDFDKEMADYATGSPDTTLLPTALSPIPPWMNMRFPEQRDTLYIFGISDPGLIDTIARQQAVLRAVALGAMADATNSEHFSDFYSQEKGSGTDSKYEEIYRFSADFSGKIPTLTILNDTILFTTEAIVLLSIPIKNLQDSVMKNIRFEAILYNNEADIMYGNKMSKKIDISIRKRNTDEMLVLDAISFYQINGKATGLRCSFPQSQAVYNHYEFYYTNSHSEQKADSAAFHGTTCKQGLWIAYVSQIMDHLSMQTKMLSKESQVMRDKTEDASAELLRERSRTRLSWRINAIDVHDDKMRVNMTISKF